MADNASEKANSYIFSGQQCDLQHCEEHGQPGNESEKRIGGCYFFGFRPLMSKLLQQISMSEVWNGNLDTAIATTIF